jgi:hypothetical protein
MADIINGLQQFGINLTKSLWCGTSGEVGRGRDEWLTELLAKHIGELLVRNTHSEAAVFRQDLF